MYNLSHLNITIASSLKIYPSLTNSLWIFPMEAILTILFRYKFLHKMLISLRGSTVVGNNKGP
jgi:hypothetical protein